jgi:hypothetical protein
LHCIQFASHLLIFPQSSFNSVSAQQKKFLPSFHLEITTPPEQIIKPEFVSVADETKYHRHKPLFMRFFRRVSRHTRRE